MGKTETVDHLLQAFRTGCAFVHRTCRSLVGSLAPLDESPASKCKPITKRLTNSQLRTLIQAKWRKPLPKSTVNPPSASAGRSHLDRRGAILADFVRFVGEQCEELMCSICRGEPLSPVCTPCFHIFCLPCIERSLLNLRHCPLCRHPIVTPEAYGLAVSGFVNRFVRIRNGRKGFGGREEGEVERLEEHAEWKRGRFVGEGGLKVGEKMDVWKLEANEWKEARIQRIYEEGGSQSEVLVRFGQEKGNSEIIELPSLRIAPLHFYTRRQPRFELTLNAFRRRTTRTPYDRPFPLPRHLRQLSQPFDLYDHISFSSISGWAGQRVGEEAGRERLPMQIPPHADDFMQPFSVNHPQPAATEPSPNLQHFNLSPIQGRQPAGPNPQLNSFIRISHAQLPESGEPDLSNQWFQLIPREDSEI